MITSLYPYTIALLLFIPFSLGFFSYSAKGQNELKPSPLVLSTTTSAIPTKIKNSVDCNSFSTGVIEERATSGESSSSCWWLDSGGLFFVNGSTGSTIVGNLTDASFWKNEYNKTNPIDTNYGTRPQNIFRLINKTKWKNVSESVLFRISHYDLSSSPNRNSSNGILLMSRYVDSDNLYYAGLRVDGVAVIKKKSGGIYTTLATAPFNSVSTYNKSDNPSLLPINTWIGEKLITQNNADGSVNLKFYASIENTDDWKLLIDVTDSVEKSGSLPITVSGNTGIRTDFMDVEFSKFTVKSP